MLNKKLIVELAKLTTVSELNEAIAYARSVVESKTKLQLTVGQKVYVVQKTKKTLGTITKINVKKAVVELPEGSYRVPLSMLEVA